MDTRRLDRAGIILCVDNDAYLADLLRYALERVGYVVQLAQTGAAAVRAARTTRPDLVIADVDLPDVDGLELCSEFRAHFGLPVILLAACETDDGVLAGFEHGADDYVVKPFSMHILICRVEAVLRRANPASAARGTRRMRHLHAGWFDTERHEISANGATVKLTPTESKILELLLTFEGQVLSADRIMDELWDYDSDTDASVIKTHIRYLRSKLASVFGDVLLIATVRGLGYTFQPTPSDGMLDQHAG